MNCMVHADIKRSFIDLNHYNRADKERTSSENSITSSSSTEGENDSTTNLDYSRKVQYCMPISVGK